MSLFNTAPSTGQLQGFIKQLYQLGTIGKLILLNFFDEKRLNSDVCDKFCTGILNQLITDPDPIRAYKKSIFNNKLLFLLERKDKNEFEAIHYASLFYLAEHEFTDILNADNPPKEIKIKKPLGNGKIALWITFDSKSELTGYSASEIRDLLGLSATVSDFLYYFKFKVDGTAWVPTSLDAFGMPPFKPYHSIQHGLTIHLADDSAGLPELLLKPLTDLKYCNKGYLVDNRIDHLPPTGYVPHRVKEFDIHPETKRWGL